MDMSCRRHSRLYRALAHGAAATPCRLSLPTPVHDYRHANKLEPIIASRNNYNYIRLLIRAYTFAETTKLKKKLKTDSDSDSWIQDVDRPEMS